MGELDVQLAGKSLADHTNTQLRLALGAVLYTNTADMWRKYLNQMGYSGDIAQMLQKYYSDYSVPQNMRNYINAGAFVYTPQQLFRDGSIGVFYDNNDFVDSATWRRNLLLRSEEFDNAAWLVGLYGNHVKPTITANVSVAPDGTTTADRMTSTHATASTIGASIVTAAPNQTFTVSCWIKAGTATTANLGIAWGNSGALVSNFYVTANLTNNFQRFTFTRTAPASGINQAQLYITIGDGVSGGGIGTTLEVWGAQIEAGASATTYQRITDFNSDFLAAFPRTTLYENAAGTVPAKVNGLVGLQLDKSANLALGADAVVNGSFDTDTNWTKGTGITISGGTLNFTSGTTLNANANQVIGATNGKYCEITIVVSAISAGILNVQFDLTAGSDISITAPGTYTYRLFQAPSYNSFYIVAKAAGTTATVDSVSVRPISGNHRYQTTSGSRPTLRGTPIGGNLVTNGTFAADTDWTKGTGWTISGGTANYTGGGAVQGLNQNYSFTAGKVYRLTYTVSSVSAGTVFTRIVGGSNIDGPTRSANGTYVEYFTAITGSATLSFRGSATGSLSIDNVELVDVSAGSVTAPYGLQYDGVDDFLQTASVNFATATSDGLARRNLLTFPSAFDDAVWTKDDLTVTANSASAPDGTTTADKLIPSAISALHRIRQIGGGTGQFVFSAYVKAAGYNFVKLRFSSNWVNFNLSNGTIGLSSGDAGSIQDVGGGWYRCSVGATLASTNTAYIQPQPTDDPDIGPIFTGDGTSGILLWGAQLEAGSTASAFQNIGTDKMFVCAGVRKLSDAVAFGMVCELSADLNSNNGAFYIVAPNTAGTPSVSYVSKGTLQAAAISSSGNPAPYLGVICGISSISSDSVIIRTNGVQASSSAADQGTGNYGNYALYFGRRGGTSLPYNGLDFGMVIVGKTLTATQISQTERFIAQRTGVTL